MKRQRNFDYEHEQEHDYEHHASPELDVRRRRIRPSADWAQLARRGGSVERPPRQIRPLANWTLGVFLSSQ